jgi:hypothetical protein
MQRFIIQNIQNAKLSTRHAMPQKDSTSDSSHSFQLGRVTYTKTTSSGIPTNTQKQTKKWMQTTSRDSSTITQKKNNNAIGANSLNNANQQFTFFSSTNKNVVNDALSRTRAGGSVVPPIANR